MVLRTVTAVSAVFLVLPGASAGATESSFAGACPQLQGTTRFDPPITNTEGPTYFHFTGSGGCDGQLDGASVSATPVVVDVAGPLQASCLQARSTSPARVLATFTRGTPDPGDDVLLRLSFVGTGTGPNFEGPVRGDKSGSGTARGTFATQRTPPDAILACGQGGLSEIATDVGITTDSPLVSESSRPAGPGTLDSRPGRPRLRLAVIPRVVSTGRWVRLRFRVRAPAGTAPSRLWLRFAGRRLRLDRRGRATARFRFRRPGPRTARVSGPGLRSARAVVRVR